MGRMGKSGSWTIDRSWEQARTDELLSLGLYPRGTTRILDKADQKAHGDLWVPTNGSFLGHELKIVRYPRSVGGITIETDSALEYRTQGWIYYSGADILDWIFLDAMLRWSMPELRKWWSEQDVERWAIYDTKNDEYTTRCRRVPIYDIGVPHEYVQLPDAGPGHMPEVRGGKGALD